jgi:hypothetical protein
MAALSMFEYANENARTPWFDPQENTSGLNA